MMTRALYCDWSLYRDETLPGEVLTPECENAPTFEIVLTGPDLTYRLCRRHHRLVVFEHTGVAAGVSQIEVGDGHS